MEAERELAKILSNPQCAAWDRLAGLAGGEEPEKVAAADPPAEKPKDAKSEVTKPVVKPETTKPETTKPETTKPDSTKPDSTKPDSTKPDSTKPDSTKPDSTKPDSTKPDSTKPDSTKPDSTKPDSTKPDSTKPDSTKPDSTKPDSTKPETTKPETKPELTKRAPPKNIEDVRLTFQFSYTPWKTVLEWFAKEADLSLIGDVVPDGTCNYRDSRQYTVAQALDLMNGILQLRGFVLIRRERMLIVHDMENGPPPQHWSELVKPEDLDKRGEYELLSCLFKLGTLSPEEVEADIRKLVGPTGSLAVLTKTKQVYVTETAAKLRAIRAILKDAEETASGKDGEFTIFTLKHKLFEEVMIPIRQHMGIPEGLNGTPDGSLRIGFAGGKKFTVTGKPDAIAKLKKILSAVDVPPDDDETIVPLEQPQVEVYAITTADPNSVLQVLRTILAGQLHVRLDVDPKTGSILAHATPTQHATIKAVIDQMQKDSRQVKVFKMRKIDPETALISLNKLFGIVEAPPANSTPRIVADGELMQIIVSGSTAQIEQIGKALAEMGETPAGSDAARAERSNTPLIGLTGRNAESALETLQANFAAAGMTNKIKVSTPSGGSDNTPFRRIPVPKDFEKRTSKPPASAADPKPTSPAESGSDNRDERTKDRDREDRFRGEDRGREERDRRERDERRSELEDRRLRLESSTGIRRTTLHRAVASKNAGRSSQAVARQSDGLGSPPYFVAWQDPELKPAADPFKEVEEAQAEKPATAETPEATEATEAAPPKKQSVPGADIVVTITPRGIMITSQDLDALDEVEAFLQEYLSNTGGAAARNTKSSISSTPRPMRPPSSSLKLSVVARPMRAAADRSWAT